MPEINIKVISLDILPMKILILNLIISKNGVLCVHLHCNFAENQTDENKPAHNILIRVSNLRCSQ